MIRFSIQLGFLALISILILFLYVNLCISYFFVLDINLLNYFQEETLYMDRDSQIKAIEKTFEDNKKPIERHYSKANVVPIEVLPVYPDFKVLNIATVILYKH